MAVKSREILNRKQLDIIIERLCNELIENHKDFSSTVLVSLMPRGKYIGKQIHKKLQKILIKNIKYGELDISFYRDDLRRHSKPIVPHKMSMNFNVDEKDVVLIDDVLFTGRTTRAAINEIFDFGRPLSVTLVVLVERNGKELPISADIVGEKLELGNDKNIKLNGPDPLVLEIIDK